MWYYSGRFFMDCDMYSQELKDLLNDPTVKRASSKCKEGTHLGTILRVETDFIGNDPKLAVRLWYVQNDIFEQVKCPHCSKPTNIKINKEGARIQFCSLVCRSASKDISGLTLAQRNGIKQSATKKTINPLTGTKIPMTFDSLGNLTAEGSGTTTLSGNTDDNFLFFRLN